MVVKTMMLIKVIKMVMMIMKTTPGSMMVIYLSTFLAILLSLGTQGFINICGTGGDWEGGSTDAYSRLQMMTG